MICPKCNHSNIDEAVFCQNCGCKLKHTYPKCGKEIKHDASFCPYCGFDIAKGNLIEPQIVTENDLNNQLNMQQQEVVRPSNDENNKMNGLQLAAYIFLIVNAVGSGISLIWSILYFIYFYVLFPVEIINYFLFYSVIVISYGTMIIVLCTSIAFAVHMKKKCNKHKPCSLAVAICTLIFANIISGILLIIDNITNKKK